MAPCRCSTLTACRRSMTLRSASSRNSVLNCGARQNKMMEFLTPSDVSPAGIGFDVMECVPTGGHFFGDQHPLDRYEKAFYAPMLCDGQTTGHGPRTVRSPRPGAPPSCGKLRSKITRNRLYRRIDARNLMPTSPIANRPLEMATPREARHK